MSVVGDGVSALSDTMFHILKISAILAVASAFSVAIFNLCIAISGFVFGGFVGEFFALVSMYLPFNANVIFLGLGGSCSAILGFLVAKKIFDLTSWSISTI